MCPLLSEWMKRLWPIQGGIQSRATGNGLADHGETQREPECTRQSEGGWSEKAAWCEFKHMAFCGRNTSGHSASQKEQHGDNHTRVVGRRPGGRAGHRER